MTSVLQGGGTNAVTNLLSYSEVGALIGETYVGGRLDGWWVTNELDELQRPKTMWVIQQGTTMYSYNYFYDAAGRMQHVNHGSDYQVWYDYLANSALVEKVTDKFGTTNVLVSTRSYDNLNRLLSIVSTTNGESAVAFAARYAYNSANQRTSLTNAENSRWAFQYDDLGQVTSGKRYFDDGTIVAGQQFEYGFDDIGNRKSAGWGGDQAGANLRYASYTVNSLNQYTQRTVPGGVDVLGSATNAATVTVNNQSTYRKGDYFRANYTFDNSTGAVWLNLTNIAVLNYGGTNLDVVTNITGRMFAVKTPEQFGYDADGNLTNDGRWAYTWDAENRLVKMESLTGAPSGSGRRLNFEYDWRGRRTYKKVTNLDTSATTERTFLYDDWNLVVVRKDDGGRFLLLMWGLDLSGTLHGAGGVGRMRVVYAVKAIAGKRVILCFYAGYRATVYEVVAQLLASGLIEELQGWEE